MKFLYTNS